MASASSARALFTNTSRLAIKAGRWNVNHRIPKSPMLSIAAKHWTQPAVPVVARLFSSSTDTDVLSKDVRDKIDSLPPHMRNMVEQASDTNPMDPNQHVPLEDVESFMATAPTKLTDEMVEVISDSVHLFLRHGLAEQRLKDLSKSDAPIVQKWQKMMEIYFNTQLQVVAQLGYQPDEKGLQHYAFHTQEFMKELENRDMQLFLHFKEMRRVSWRQLVSTTFDLNLSEIPELTIVQARDFMHTVASRMQSPEILLQVQKKVGRVSLPTNEEQEATLKHTALQEIIVNEVYLGGGMLKKMGFPAGATGYAAFQCAVSEFEGDPLISEYTMAAMKKLWEAAGLNIEEVMVPGATPRATP